MLLNKLPAGIRLIVNRSITAGNRNLDVLIRTLCEATEAGECAVTAEVCVQPRPNKKLRDFQLHIQ